MEQTGSVVGLQTTLIHYLHSFEIDGAPEGRPQNATSTPINSSELRKAGIILKQIHLLLLLPAEQVAIVSHQGHQRQSSALCRQVEAITILLPESSASIEVKSPSLKKSYCNSSRCVMSNQPWKSMHNVTISVINFAAIKTQTVIKSIKKLQETEKPTNLLMVGGSSSTISSSHLIHYSVDVLMRLSFFYFY